MEALISGFIKLILEHGKEEKRESSALEMRFNQSA